MRGIHRVWGLAFVFLIFSSNNLVHASGSESDSGIQGIHPDFAYDKIQSERLKKHVDFWIQINSQYSNHEGLIHDAIYVDRIYQVIHLKSHRGSSSGLIRNTKAKWRRVLLSVHQKQNHPEQMNEDEKKVFELFKGIDEPNKFLNAAHRKRLRFQLGQRDSFIAGYYHSGKYLKWMEKVFQREGLPVELSRLPFVESSFNLKARSKVGASGLWQFMKSTAEIFIQVNERLDERNDPIRATEGAAKLLKMNYGSLGSWPLAVTAYNHGRKNLMRVVRRLGTQRLEDLMEHYNSRSFGFASSNFFAELVAFVELERNPERYLGKMKRLNPIRFVEVQLPEELNLKVLVRYLGLNIAQFNEFNTALSDEVYLGKSLIPKGYWLRLPVPQGKDEIQVEREFFEKYQQIPQIYKEKGQGRSKYAKSGGLS